MELTIKILLGLVTVSVARPRTVYRFKGDDAEHWQEGAPGISVTGFYSWTSPEGSEFYVKYIADKNGYRILDSNAIPIDHTRVAADGNQVMSEALEMEVVPVGHDGLVVFDSAKTEPEDQAIIDYTITNSVSNDKDVGTIFINQEVDDLSENYNEQSEEFIESTPIPIETVDTNEVLSSIDEELEDSTQPPVIVESEIIDSMLDASSSFGERNDDVQIVPIEAPIMITSVVMSETVENFDMEVESNSEAKLSEPSDITIEIEDMARGGTKRTFAPIVMKNGELVFMELKPNSDGNDGEASSSSTDACALCEMQIENDYNDDTL